MEITQPIPHHEKERRKEGGRHTCSFSSAVMVHPGLCSPSRRVVSKILTRMGSRPVLMSWRVGIGLTTSSS